MNSQEESESQTATSNWEFEIPVVETDLFIGSEGGVTLRKDAFRVSNVSTNEETTANQHHLIRQIRESEAAIRSNPTSITTHKVFDPIFRCLSSYSTLSNEIKSTLIEACCSNVSSISRLLQSNPALSNVAASQSSQQQQSQQTMVVLLGAKETSELRNSVKMSVFLLTWLIKLSERDLTNGGLAAENTTSLIVPAKSSKTPKSSSKTPRTKRGRTATAATTKPDGNEPSSSSATINSSISGWNSEEIREKALSALLEILETEGLSKLWRQPRPEEGFITLFTRTSFLILENPSNSKNKTLRRCVSLMIGTLIKQFGQVIGITATAVHLLHSHEHLPTPLSEIYFVISTEFDGHHAVGSIIREIAKLEASELAREIKLAKNVSSFVCELAEKLPLVVLPAISVLLPHLKCGESHIIRNGIVQTLGILAMKTSSKIEGNEINNHNNDSENEERISTDNATRDSLLEVLEERFRDVSSYARSKAIQTWIPLVKNRIVPLVRLKTLTEKTVERLDDKAAQVRRSAVQLLTVLLQFNPFSPRLEIEVFRKKRLLCDKIFEEIEQNPSENEDEDGTRNPSILNDGNEEEEEVDLTALKAINQERFVEIFSGTPFETEWIGKSGMSLLQEIRKFHSWAKDGTDFAEAMGKTVKRVVELLISKNTTDIIEAMEFIVAADQFVVEGSKVAVKKMLFLAWSKETQVRETLVEEFTKLVFSRPKIKDIANGLIELVTDASPSEIVSMEELLWLSSEKGRLDPLITNALVDVISNSSSNKKENRHSAMLVLSMIASADPILVASKIGNIVNAALNDDNWFEDPTLAMRACEVLQRLRRDESQQEQQEKQNQQQQQQQKQVKKEKEGNEDDDNEEFDERGRGGGGGGGKKKGKRGTSKSPDTLTKKMKEENEEDDGGEAKSKMTDKTEIRKVKPTGIARLENNHELFIKLCKVIEGGRETENNERVTLKPSYSSWAPVAEQAVNAIQILAENPDHVFEGLIKNLHSITFENTKKISSERLARLIFLIGHIAIRMLVQIEVIAKHMESTATQKRNNQQQQQQQHKEEEEKEAFKATTKKGKKNKGEGEGNSASPKKRKSTNSSSQGNGVDEGEGEGAGVVSEATDAEAAQMNAEKELVSNGSMLGYYIPLIQAICTNSGGFYNNPSLRAAGITALGKLTISGGSEFCETQIRLLVTVLETAPEAELRATVIAVLGDLCARFPNIAEPWTPHIYAMLRDSDARVRRNSAAVLSHLVLNDMIKLKGHVAALALALEDADERVKELAKLFFTELSKKGNAVYNVLPDAISSLSAALANSNSNTTTTAATTTALNSTNSSTEKLSNVTWESFKRIVKFLFGFLQKERQFEALLEKLCARFRTAEDSKAIAFCLTQLTLNEKCIRKLIELYPMYQDKLIDDEVFESFNAVISRARKFARPEMKSVTDELEKKIEISRGLRPKEDGKIDDYIADVIDDENGETKKVIQPKTPKKPPTTTATPKTPKATKRTAGTTTKRGKGKKKKEISSSESEDDESSLNLSSDEEEKKKNKKKQVKKTKAKKKTKKSSSSSSSSSDSSSEEEKSKSKSKTTKQKNKEEILVEASSDESSS